MQLLFDHPLHEGEQQTIGDWVPVRQEIPHPLVDEPRVRTRRTGSPIAGRPAAAGSRPTRPSPGSRPRHAPSGPVVPPAPSAARPPLSSTTLDYLALALADRPSLEVAIGLQDGMDASWAESESPGRTIGENDRSDGAADAMSGGASAMEEKLAGEDPDEPEDMGC